MLRTYLLNGRSSARREPPAPAAHRAQGVQLADAGTAEKPVEVPSEKWIHVATEGQYLGYGDKPLNLDRATFTSFVANLRKDPRYKASEGGVGSTPVIPFDYEHASEMMPTEGSIPANGAPAPAWVLDLKVVDGEDGKAQLWAYAKLGDTIREYIGKGEYRYTSIAFVEQSVDPVSGTEVGARLTSIAFTNHPFLRNLSPMAARAQRGSRSLSSYYGDTASSPAQGFEYTRCILNLPASHSVDEVLVELGKLVAWAENPATLPPGIPLDDLMSDLRRAWGVPLTSTPSDLVATATKAAAALIQQVQQPTEAPAGSLTSKEPPMNEFAKRLLAILFKAKFLSRGGRAITLQSDDDVAAAVEEVVSQSAELGTVLEALGVANAGDALKAIPDLKAAKAKLEDALSQLNEALGMQAQIDAMTETQDVAAAMTARNYPDDEGVRKALGAQRASCIATEVKKLGDKQTPKALDSARRAGRQAFLAEYGVTPEGQEYLLSNLVAGPGGQQLHAPGTTVRLTTGSHGAPNGSGAPGLKLGTGGRKTIDLRGLDGVNQTARLLTWCNANDPGFDKLNWEQKNKRAHTLRRDQNVEIIDAQ